MCFWVSCWLTLISSHKNLAGRVRWRSDAACNYVKASKISSQLQRSIIYIYCPTSHQNLNISHRNTSITQAGCADSLPFSIVVKLELKRILDWFFIYQLQLPSGIRTCTVPHRLRFLLGCGVVFVRPVPYELFLFCCWLGAQLSSKC